MWSLPDDCRTWSVYIALVALVTALTFGSLSDLLLDTHEDEIFRDHLAADGLSYFFKSAAEKEFNSPGRPITEIARYLGFLVWGNDPGLFHLYCAAVHAVASLLLALAARCLGAPLGLSLLGGLLFLLNVSHFRGVHYISGLDYPLAQVFCLGAVISYARYVAGRLAHWLWAMGGCLVLATASHQAAVMVVPFLLYYTWSRQGRFMVALGPLIPIGLVLLFEVYLLLQITDREGATTWVSLRQLGSSSLWASLAAMARVMCWLTGRLFSTAHWLPLTVYEQQDWEIYFGGLVLVGMVYLICRRRGLLADWSIWIPLSLVPFTMVSEEIHLHLVHGPSRHLYMASAGSSLLLAWVLQDLGQALVRKLAVWGSVLYGVALVGLGVLSYTCLKKTEALSHYSIGRFYLVQQDLATGIAELERAIAKGADLIPLEDAYYRLYVVKLGLGMEVEEDLHSARQARPEYRRLDLVHYALASLSNDPAQRRFVEQKLYATAQAIEREDRLDARSMLVSVYNNIGLGASRNRAFERAVPAYRKALVYDRDRADICLSMGVAFCEMGQFEKGIETLVQARELNPQNAEVHARLGLALFESGSTESAIDAYAAALAHDQEHLTARINLGWALYTLGRFAEAIDHYLAALQNQANSVASFNLGLAYLAIGDEEAAQKTYAQAIAAYGAEHGAAIGATADLKALGKRAIRPEAVREILHTYWPQ